MGETISRKIPQATEHELNCQRCGQVFAAANVRQLYCPGCIEAEYSRLISNQKKTEPSEVSQIAPSPIGMNSLSQSAPASQVDISNRPEKGKSRKPVSPRLPSVPLGSPETQLRNMPEIAQLGSTAIYPTPPTTKPANNDLVIGAFRLLNPVQKLYVDDFKSDEPVIDHGKTGWPHRSAFCHHATVPGLVGVELRRKDDDKGVHVSLGGVVHCGNIWMCSVCGTYNALKWQQDVIAAERELRRQGYRLVLCVLTLSHHTDTELAQEIAILRDAYTELFQQRKKGQKKRAKRWGIVGRLRAWDILYGSNGWHGHMNITIVLEPGSKIKLADLHQELSALYRQAVHKAGGFASTDYGLVLTEYKNGKAYSIRSGMEGLETRTVGDKFALGYEAISTDQKSQHGLTIGALRLATVHGYQRQDLAITAHRAAELCLEYAATMSGERSVISAGVMREVLRQVGTAEDRTDAENSAAPVAGYDLLGIIKSADYHKEIVGKYRWCELLLAMRSGPADLSAFLSGIGIDLEKRDNSLQANAIFSHAYADEKDRARALDGVERAALIWRGGAITNEPGNDLDEFL